MGLQIGLLRAINVGGRNLVGMAALRDLLAKLGFSEAKTLQQSGNIVFNSSGHQGAKLESLLEEKTEKQFKVRVDYFIRTPKEWKEIIAGNPFREEAKADPGHLVVMFLKTAPPATAVQALQAAVRGPEIFQVTGKHAYIFYSEGIGRSKLTSTLIESKLASRGTGRNWNTVLKLWALADQ